MRRPRHPALLLCALVAASACDDQEASQSREPERELEIGGPGARVHVRLSPLSIEVRDGGGRAVLTSAPSDGADAYGPAAATLDEPTISPQILPGWDGYEAGEQPWRRATSARIVAQTSSSVSLAVEGPGVRVDYDVSVTGARVSLHMTARAADGAPEPNKVAMSFTSPGDEHFLGMGERFASSDHRGLSLYSWAEEGSIGQGESAPPGPKNPYPNGPSMTYFPVPFFLSTRGYGARLATTYRTEHHFASERPDAWRVAANSASLEAVIYVHDDPLLTLDALTADTGRPVVPAPWVFGLRRRVGVDAKVGDTPEHLLMRQKKIACTAVDDAVHFLPALSHLGREAQLAAWTSELHARGYKAMAYNNPYVASNDPSAAADYAYGKSHGLFIKRPDGEPAITFFISGKPLDIATIDLTNPDAVTWFQGLLRRTLELGYDGWMHDFGEYVPRDAVLFDGRRGDEFHNAFPVLSAKAAHDLMERERPGDYLFFVRSGGPGTQAYAPAVWGGDAEATFDETQGLPSALRSGVNLATSGVPYWGSDMTGFKCLTNAPRDKDVFLRWVELGAVSPIMMEQNACANPTASTKPTKWTLWSDEQTTDVYRRWASFHTRLQPYFQVLAATAHERGTPLMRHPFLMHPREPEAALADDTFWLGPALYAAPVVRRAVVERSLWLPPGRYVDLDDGRAYTGGATVTVPAPLEKLPLFLAEGQLLPMLDPTIDTLAPATDPSVVTPARVADRLDVVVALGPGREAKLTLADGTVLSASRVDSDQGNPASLSPSTAAGLGECAGCFVTSTRAGLSRVQVNGALAASSELRLGRLVLSSSGGPARRVRWDVTEL
ncbi:MAG: glycoside hydrolase family 31 protein [Polyangiaceae bacterium]|nr:glycoside hydrolase family 31 protein [Polyangiaceae bacterium]